MLRSISYSAGLCLLVAISILLVLYPASINSVFSSSFWERKEGREESKRKTEELKELVVREGWERKESKEKGEEGRQKENKLNKL